MAAGVAGGVLDRDVRALASVGLAAGTVRAKVTELDATQAQALALRERLAGQEAAIGRVLAERTARLATARAEVRAQVRAEQARQEAARRAMVAAAATRARALRVRQPGRHPGPQRHCRHGRAGRARPGRQALPVGGDRPGVVRPSTTSHVRRPGADGPRPHTGALVRVDALRPSGYAGATRPSKAGKA